MLTKDDLTQISVVVKETIQPELKALETRVRTDLEILGRKLVDSEKRLIERIEEAQMEIVETVDKHKVDKNTVTNLEHRVERLEDHAGLPPYSAQ